MFTSRIGLAPGLAAGVALHKRIRSAARWTLGVWVVSLVLLGSLAAAGAGATTTT
jgi:hypothetical protein